MKSFGPFPQSKIFEIHPISGFDRFGAPLPDGTRLTSDGRFGGLCLWELSSDLPLWRAKFPGRINIAILSPDGSVLSRWAFRTPYASSTWRAAGRSARGSRYGWLAHGPGTILLLFYTGAK